ncbi:helix-turn-helix transcriptional regulator [Streptomyces sp. NPDC088757]|uniref:AraC family transcriptional regulator n=1 Tax=Streptomyces sp. NPDC088757 TaxID=3365889 RepID=UPI00380F142C
MVEVTDGRWPSGGGPRSSESPGGSELREVVFCTPLRGASFLPSESTGRLESGHLLLIDSHRHLRMVPARGCELAVLRIPRELLPCGDDSLARVVGRSHDAATGTAALLLPLLHALATRDAPSPVDAYGHGTAARLRNMLADLVACLVEEVVERELEADRGGSGSADREATDRIRRWTNARLADSRLRPDTVATAHYMSVRRLHKLFERESGTISRWIQQRRLEECRRELGRGDGRPVMVSSVAQRWGFVNAAHFSRAFRAKYGMSPRAWRKVRTGLADAVDVVPPLFGRPLGEAVAEENCLVPKG